MSFDNIGSQFEYVRHGASWQLQQHNLDLVQDLMRNNGHWGGIHAVYSIYNATRLVGFKQFATHRGLSIRWQNIGGKPALDPRQYGNEIARLAADEIEQVFAQCAVDDQEQELFGAALAHYQLQTTAKPDVLEELRKFTAEIEQYHPDQAGKFALLWPELGTILWP
jgi:hypothetical protein